jgi:hypothetical protein
VGHEQQPENPYIAPVFPEPAVDTVAWHQSYLVNGRKVICRNGLWLPEYCLVTGASADLVPIPISLWAAGKSARRYRLWGIGSLCCAPLLFAAALLLMRSGARPGDPVPVALTVSIPLTLVGGLVLFLLGGRQRQLCRLHGSLQRQRAVWQRRLATIPGFVMLFFLVLRFFGVIERDWAFAAVVGPFVATWLLAGLVFLRGLRLRAIQVEDGLFEVKGWSGAFLKRLEERANGG